ncbi:SMI1/KNR4 family protein [Candidatus Cardinium hertigii]|uniref:SMI1/KNR4 family protein n=1 Tax=Candidatus Cardinium hertigii TaxID=247481 RepID=UPI003D7D4A55
MLNKKNLYLLLHVLFLVQLGCSSRYISQMSDSSKGDDSTTGGASSTSTGYEDQYKNTEIYDMVEKFFDDEKQKIKKGLCINRQVIELAIAQISGEDEGINIVDIESLPKDYIQFLSIYGCIYGQGHAISGPTDQSMTDYSQKANYIASIQRSFKEICIDLGQDKERIKSYWLIAELSDIEQYYIDLSDKGRGRIYSINRIGNSKIFAKNFQEFLKKFLDSFKEYEESTSDEN